MALLTWRCGGMGVRLGLTAAPRLAAKTQNQQILTPGQLRVNLDLAPLLKYFHVLEQRAQNCTIERAAAYWKSSAPPYYHEELQQSHEYCTC